MKVGKEDTAVIASSAELSQTELYRKKFLWDFLPRPSLPACHLPHSLSQQRRHAGSRVATAGGMKFKHGKNQKIEHCVMSLYSPKAQTRLIGSHLILPPCDGNGIESPARRAPACRQPCLTTSMQRNLRVCRLCNS